MNGEKQIENNKEILRQLWLPTRYWGVSDSDMELVISRGKIKETLGNKSLFLHGDGIVGAKIAAYLIKQEVMVQKRFAFVVDLF